MTTITNPSAHGTATPVTAQSQPRDPIAGVAFASHAANPAIGGIQTTFDSQVRHVSDDMRIAAGGPLPKR
jgi:hypothetical protein